MKSVNNRRLKIAYICHFSNAEIHNKLPLHLDIFTRLLLAKNHLPQNTDVEEFAVWNSNAINELRNYKEAIELHVIAPYHFLKPKTFSLESDGIYYHFFRSDDDYLPLVLMRRLFNRKCDYKRNRKIIKDFVSQISPDIIHVVGIENPYYSMCVFDMPHNIPVIVQLQTLLNAPEFKMASQGNDWKYLYRSEVERNILEQVTYVGFGGKYYNQIIREQFNKNAIFLKTVLALAEPIDISFGEKKYDFVYFASDISKAADLAVEAFILASQKSPNITLNIVGGYNLDIKLQLEKRLAENNLLGKVTFSGKLQTHEDVIRQIRLSRYALLPLKLDFISGTIREAMANGLPVVTTKTEGTPKLNEKYECALLSDVGDHGALADNMCKLLEQPRLVEKLRVNGGKFMEEKDSNGIRIRRYVDIYYAVLDHFHDGSLIPDDLLS